MKQYDLGSHNCLNVFINTGYYLTGKKGKRIVQGVPQSQATVHPRHEEEEETNKTKQAQIEQTSGKH